MEITNLIEVLQKAKKDGYKNVIWAYSDWTEGGDFSDRDYSHNKQGKPGDIVLMIKGVRGTE